ncbi:MAG: hypothetical protein MnENMB40S_13690 [Rhizobiaceae bacterium MnEN-MB40S]|nr:MAG: hypothetical protein MnENMB40S_13690 [Rhizobiaceae bacterium MnEN-MB40S]
MRLCGTIGDVSDKAAERSEPSYLAVQNIGSLMQGVTGQIGKSVSTKHVRYFRQREPGRLPQGYERELVERI